MSVTLKDIESMNLSDDFALSYYRLAALQGNKLILNRLIKLYIQQSSSDNQTKIFLTALLERMNNNKIGNIQHQSASSDFSASRPSRWTLLNEEEQSRFEAGMAKADPVALNALGVDSLERSFDESLNEDECADMQNAGIELIFRAAILGNTDALYNYTHYALLSGICSHVNLKAAQTFLSVVGERGFQYAKQKSTVVQKLIDWVKRQKSLGINIDDNATYDELRQKMGMEFNNHLSTGRVAMESDTPTEFLTKQVNGQDAGDVKHQIDYSAQRAHLFLSNSSNYSAAAKIVNDDIANKENKDDGDKKNDGDYEMTDLVNKSGRLTPVPNQQKSLRPQSRGSKFHEVSNSMNNKAASKEVHQIVVEPPAPLLARQAWPSNSTTAAVAMEVDSGKMNNGPKIKHKKGPSSRMRTTGN